MMIILLRGRSQTSRDLSLSMNSPLRLFSFSRIVQVMHFLKVFCLLEMSVSHPHHFYFLYKMDSEVKRDGRLMDLVDQQWKEDTLPKEDICVPQMELPELEPDNGHSNETLKEQEQKWVDLALNQLHEHPPQNVASS